MLEDQMVISCYNEEDAKTLMEIALFEQGKSDLARSF